VLRQLLIAGDRGAAIVDMAPIGRGPDDGKALQEARVQFLYQVGPGREELGFVEVADLQTAADRPGDHGQAVAGMLEPLAQLCLGRKSGLVRLPGNGWGLAAIALDGDDRQAGISQATRLSKYITHGATPALG
jgi:hypothetical protein